MNTKNFAKFTPIEYGLKKKNLTNLKMMIMYQQSQHLNDCITQIQTGNVSKKNGYIKMLLKVMAIVFVISCIWYMIAMVSVMIDITKKDESCPNQILQCMANDYDFNTTSFCRKKFLMEFHCDSYWMNEQRNQHELVKFWTIVMVAEMMMEMKDRKVWDA